MNRTPGARKDTAQANRFIKAAREAGCSEDEAEIRENVKRVVSAPLTAPAPTKNDRGTT